VAGGGLSESESRAWGEEYVELPLLDAEALLDDEPNTAQTPERVLAFRRWIARPESTFAIRLDDEAMEPVLPMGSILGVDRSARNPAGLQGRIVVANYQEKPLVRQLELSSGHLILKASRPGRDLGMIAISWSEASPSPILGQVVWSWSRFDS
jgi:SOS-response transcriptional repressor LexA